MELRLVDWLRLLDTQILLTLCLGLLLVQWLFEQHLTRDMPPGPFQWPLVGCLPQVALHARDPHGYLLDLGRKHGGLFSLRMGSYQGVYITDYGVLKEAFVRHWSLFNDKCDWLTAYKAAVNCDKPLGWYVLATRIYGHNAHIIL